jgi:threonine synthase
LPYVSSLRCRECSRTYEVAPTHVCEWCLGPLEVDYDYDRIAAAVSRAKIGQGPPTLWRYADLLPVDPAGAVDLGAGLTPLTRADRLAEELGLVELWVKNDTLNPTNSFKDRPVTVALTKAREFGYKTVACASTGNLANAVGAHAARAGLASYVFVPADLEPAKIIASSVYGTVVPVAGTYDDVNRLCAELEGTYDWAFVNVNLRPFYAEGSKTLAYEVVEQLGWKAPDHVVVPIASGALLTKIKKGFEELWQVGLLEEPASVRVSGAQAEGCSPVAAAFAQERDHITPQRPSTIAKSLAIGDPADGYYALEAVRQTGGSVAAVSDEEIISAVGRLAQTTGIFTEPAGGVTVAALQRLVAEGVITRDERVVIYITGHGLKALDALAPQPELAAIPASVDDFRRAFEPKE